MLTTTIRPHPILFASDATCKSCRVTPSSASITSKAMSACFKRRRAIATLAISACVPMRDRLRIPAVSTRMYWRPLLSSRVSIGSRVVPGWSLTITRSEPRSALTKEDLPTFGRPTNATRVGRFLSIPTSVVSGKRPMTVSSKSATPKPSSAAITYIKSIPSS